MAGHQDTRAPVEREIHVPQSSLSPAIIGLGVTILAFGVLFGLWLILLGGAIIITDVATWLIDDARAMVSAQRSEGDGHGAQH